MPKYVTIGPVRGTLGVAVATGVVGTTVGVPGPTVGDGDGSTSTISNASSSVTKANVAMLSARISNVLGMLTGSARKTSTANCKRAVSPASGGVIVTVAVNNDGVPVVRTGGGANCQAVSGACNRLATRKIAVAGKPVEKYGAVGSEMIMNEEKTLTITLEKFPAVLGQACQEMSPSVIAAYAFELAKTFNSFYAEHSVSAAETPDKTP